MKTVSLVRRPVIVSVALAKSRFWSARPQHGCPAIVEHHYARAQRGRAVRAAVGLRDQPLVQADLFEAIGAGFLRLGLFQEGAEVLERAERIVH